MKSSVMINKSKDGNRPKDLGMLVVIGGPGGSGSSTIARHLARDLGLSYFYSGLLMKKLSKEKGYKTVEGFFKSKYFEENSNLIDKWIDKETLKISQKPNILIDSKNFSALSHKKKIPCTVKIWLHSDINTRVHRHLLSSKRIKNGTKLEKDSKLYKSVRNRLSYRYSNDKKRHSQLYGVDYDHHENYNNIVIDTSKMNVAQTLRLIKQLLKDEYSINTDK